MKRSNVNLTIALLVLGSLATACGGDTDSDADAADTAAPSGGDGRVDDGLFGDEAVRTDDLAPADPTGNELSAAESAEASAEAGGQASAATTAPAADAEGGLFGSDPTVPQPDPARLEDNTFRDYGYRDFVAAATDPLSTFALDVDTGSYTVTRRWIDEGALPPAEAVRPEEYINAFEYDYRVPRHGLDVSVDGGPSPFDTDRFLVRVGVQGEVVDERDRGPVALTFVVDTSGSMDRDDRLGLVKRSLEVLIDELDADDSVAIVTYDDDAGVVLDPTPVADREVILDAIDRLRPGGSTNLEAGLRTGYALAAEALRSDGINRVVLASDGVANVGNTDPSALVAMVADDSERGIDLVTVGFGMGNYNDVTMEQLADRGGGFYAYVDTDDEAERLFQDELTSTLVTIAKDAKIQVEFDPAVVGAYRLIGFENRGVRDDQFRDDTVDAGELGAGHQATAIYEIELVDGVTLEDRADIGTVFLRWEDPLTGAVDEIDDDIRLRDIEPDWAATAEDFQLATVVASFAELMRDNPYAGAVDIDDLSDEADRLAAALDERDVDDLADLIDRAASLR